MTTLTADIYNRIQDLYQQLIVAANQSSATTNCSIGIGTITGDMNNNCIVNIINSCRNQNDSLALLDIAAEKILSINNNTSYNLLAVYNQLRQDCIAQTNLLQNINIQNIDLGTCKPRFRTEFNFVNSGEAVSNCLTNGLLKLTQEQSILTESSLTDYYPYIALGLIGLGVAAIILIPFHYKTFKIVWRKT